MHAMIRDSTLTCISVDHELKDKCVYRKLVLTLLHLPCLEELRNRANLVASSAGEESEYPSFPISVMSSSSLNFLDEGGVVFLPVVVVDTLGMFTSSTLGDIC